ncbi:MAG: hypothetical protein ACRDCJ_02095 [Metamycoplasmataceae bacterium]
MGIVQEEKKKIHKKLKMILMFGILALICGIIFIPLLIIIESYIYDYDNLVVRSPGEILFIIPMIFLLIGLVSNITLSIIILASDFENKEVNNNRILWGLLSLLLLGAIGIIIFSAVNMKKYSDYENAKATMKPEINNTSELSVKSNSSKE